MNVCLWERKECVVWRKAMNCGDKPKKIVQTREGKPPKRISKSLVLFLFTLYLAPRGGLKEACVHGAKESLSPASMA